MYRNIPLLYLIKFSKWFMLVMPIIVPFYKSNGLNMTDIFVLQAAYSLSTVILEIPSGYFADAYGRKRSMVLGAALGLAGHLQYCFAHGFMGFLSAEIILGIGISFVSGSDSALLYDSLLEMKKENKYVKYEGMTTSVGNFAEAVAGIAGGALALISLRMPFYFQAFIGFIALPSSIFLLEPHLHAGKLKVSWKDIFKVVHYSLIGHRELRFNILFSSVIGASTLTMAWFVQPFFGVIHIPTGWYGVLWTLLNALVGILAFQAHRIDNILNQKTSMLLITVLISGGYFFLAVFQNWYGLAVLAVFYLARGYATPVLKDYINKLTPSEMRATVLSVRNFIIRGLFAGIGPMLGYFTDQWSLATGLTAAGMIYMLLSFLFLTLRFAPKAQNNL